MALLQRTANMNSASGINIALLRLAHIHDRMALLCRFKIFNVLTLMNLGSNWCRLLRRHYLYKRPLAFQPLSALGVAQSALYPSDGPHSMQVALKLMF